jgi:glutamate--cysteine ligase
VEKTIRRIAKKYAEYGIEQEPFVFIKADSGSFGMGIMTATSGDDVLEVNKKLRNKMSSTKDSIGIAQVIIQEGVPTNQKFAGKSAESLVYMVAGEVVDSFLRVNDDKSALENLNSSGMHFEQNAEQTEMVEIVAKLAAIAAANEI